VLDGLLESFRFPPTQIRAQRPGWTWPEAESPEDGDEEQQQASRMSPWTPGAVPPSAPPPIQMHTRPAIIEISSSRSASGKTNLLYYLTSIAILPPECGGKGSAVVWIDADGRFSASRLMQIALHYLCSSSIGSTDQERFSTAREALKHVHTFQPQSSSKLVSILQHLDRYLLDSTGHLSSYRWLGLMVLDSATAFYWPDRFDADVARLEAVPGPDNTTPAASGEQRPSKTAETIMLLKQLQARFECSVLFTTQATVASVSHPQRPQNKASARMAPEEPGPQNPWTAFATLTLSMARLHVPPFASSMTMDECVQERQKRMEVLAQGRFGVHIDWRKTPGETRGGVGQETFVLTVTREGVDIETESSSIDKAGRRLR